ncbi:DUF6714 family protein [Poriferisphaera sp. WC338]|uniref:DUF6714 family protein n=1 Tax=Poriferisphaera sp. WC338 TaxID=3425129 RepID=UPI003D818148
MLKIETQWLIDQIRETFGSILLSDGVSLHQTDVIDDYCEHDKKLMAKAKAKDTDNRWWNVSVEVIEKQQWAWSFFDVKGYRYYLPAFMTYYLKNVLRDWSEEAIAPVLYSLNPSDARTPYHQTFNKEQSKVIAMFLWQYCEFSNWEDFECAQAKEALSAYWGQFLEPENGEITFPQHYDEQRPHKLKKVGVEWLKLVIRNSFDDVELGDGETLHQADTEGGVCCTREEYRALRLLDPEKHWWEVPKEKIERFNSIWSFIDHKGFLFYLPAYLTHCVQDPEDCMLAEEFLIYTLQTISDPNYYSKYHSSERMALLNQAQKRVVALFLWHCGERDNWKSHCQNEIDDALLNYWMQWIEDEV